MRNPLPMMDERGVRVARHSSFFTILERMRMNAVTTHGTRRKQLNVRFEEDMRGLSVAQRDVRDYCRCARCSIVRPLPRRQVV